MSSHQARDLNLTISDADAQALVRAEHANPFSILGPHADAEGLVVRSYQPDALELELIDSNTGETLQRLQQPQIPGLFVGRLAQGQDYLLRIRWASGIQETEDPYSFGPLLGDMDMYLFSEGNHRDLAHCLGAQVLTVAVVSGVRFAVWAPNARRVSIVGHFNSWDGRRHPMRLRYPAGIWELFVPRLQPGEIYKYEILGPHGVLPLRADPMALRTEAPPATGSVVAEPLNHQWQDHEWIEQRPQRQQRSAAMTIYELHAGSWQREDGDGRMYNWSELSERLIPYVTELGFTHIELMPIMEHPFGGSWGYQVLSQFAPSARFGSPAEFAAFVDACHGAGLGVILDWVPGHFPTDAHGLSHFDGTALYEYEHPFEGFHQDWDTAIYNLGRIEVHGFMLASALHWLRQFHVDALRVDAVASMLYRDYSRKQDEWIPNKYGGRENLEVIDFLRHLNDVVKMEVPGALVIAEESTAFPGVSHPTQEGGLGFDYKWNMGWMHDTLKYISEDSVNRRYHHHQLTFGLLYAFTENFILPISHDEVVHGKRSLLDKMPGDRWQKFANLRLYLSFMWTHPGKKLLFMGCEFGSWREWNHDRELDWYLLRYSDHQGVQKLLKDLNYLYRQEAALHQWDERSNGFQWLIGDDPGNSVYAWLRFGESAAPVLVVHNFTPVPRSSYRIGVPKSGAWIVLLNSDAEQYAGSNAGSGAGTGSHQEAQSQAGGTLIELATQDEGAHGQPVSLVLDLPPLGCLILRPLSDKEV